MGAGTAFVIPVPVHAWWAIYTDITKRYRIISRPKWNCPDSKVYGANMGRTWGLQDPGGPHVGPMNHAIWVGP